MPRTVSGKSRTTARVGATVRRLRNDLGLTQQALAERAGTHRTYLAELEAGRRNIAVTNLARVVAALEIPLATFFKAVDRAPWPGD